MGALVETSSWVPRGVALDLPRAGRLESVLPARDMARLNRAFLGRVVDFLAHAGIRQFLDLGSGIPTVGNVHEMAQRVRPDSRVVYVDYEPVAVAHSEMLLRDNQNAGVVQADLRKPDEILHARVTRRLLDFGEPVALLMVGVVQFVPDADDPWALAATYRDALAPGSYLALSAFTADNAPEGMAGAVEVFRNSQDPIHPRTREEIIRMFDGFELVGPGVVYTPQWRPEREDDVGDNVRRANLYAGVGYKP